MTIIRSLASGASSLSDRLPLTGRNMMGGAGNALGVNSSIQGAIGNYKAVGALFGVTNRIAESVAMVDWNLYQQKAKGERTLIDNCAPPAMHEASALWMQPNPWFSKLDFFTTDQQYMSLAGKSHWLICQGGENGPTIPTTAIKSPLEMWNVHPSRISPVPDKDRYIIGWVYRNGGELVPLPREAVVFQRIPDPDNPMDGYGPVQSIMSDLDLTKYATMHGRNYYLNGAEPGGLIEFDTSLTDTEFDKLVNRWREQHQGVSNAHRVAVLERGHWIDRKSSMRDNQYEQMQKVNREATLIPFGMHSASMGISENVNKANAEVARTDMAQGILKPRLERIKGAANGRIMPFFGDGLLLDYEDPTPQDATVKINEANAMFLGGLGRRNECRIWAGWDPDEAPEGELYHVPAAPGPTGPTVLVDPAGKSAVDIISKSWPKVMTSHEERLQKLFGGALDTVRGEFIDYLERQG